MSSFPLRTVILPAVLISSAVFSTLTLPFVLLKEPIAIDIPPLLSGGRIEPMFDAENKDVAIRYVGIAILLSVGAGIGTVELLRARHSAQELTQTKNQLSTLKLSLQEKSGQADGSRPSESDDSSADEDSNGSFGENLEQSLDGQETESLTLTFDQYVAAESLGQNFDAFPLVQSEARKLVEEPQAISPFNPLSPEQETTQPNGDEDMPLQNGYEFPEGLQNGTVQTGSNQTDAAYPSLDYSSGLPSPFLQESSQDAKNSEDMGFNGLHFASSSPIQETQEETQEVEDLDPTAAQISTSREQYQTCRVRVPHLERRIFAVLVRGEYYGLFRSGITQEKALEIVTKLIHRGDQPVITQTEKGYAVWVWQPEAQPDELTV